VVVHTAMSIYSRSVLCMLLYLGRTHTVGHLKHLVEMLGRHSLCSECRAQSFPQDGTFLVRIAHTYHYQQGLGLHRTQEGNLAATWKRMEKRPSHVDRCDVGY
jgi:hypothetical protein